MVRSRTLVVAGLLLLSPVAAQARQESEGRPLIQAGLGAAIGVPVGDFSDHVNIAAGIAGHVGFGIGQSPFSIGAEGTLLFYGSETRDIPLSGVPELTVPVTTSNDMLLVHGRLRYQKQTGRVRPYVDGLVGLNYLATSTSVEGDESCSDFFGTWSCSDNGDSYTNLDDFAFSAGGGAGVMFALGHSPNPMRLDLSLRYLYGGEANYLTGDYFPTDRPAHLEARRTRTDLLLFYIGLAWGR
jgi:hypothetical protein